MYSGTVTQSLRFKEGRILCDTLTAEESRRFHIAVYLFLHYQAIWRSFQGYATGVSGGGEEEEVDAREDALQDAKTMHACDGFLAGLSTDELLWVQELSEFLLQDVEHTLDLKNNPTYFNQFGFTARNAVNLSTGSRYSTPLASILILMRVRLMVPFPFVNILGIFWKLGRGLRRQRICTHTFAAQGIVVERCSFSSP
jgi:hypothetical protein